MVIFFDLDGTLLDSLYDIARCSNLALSENGLKEFELEEYRYFVGEGAKALAAKISSDESLTNKVYEDFKKHYKDGWKENTKPYDGIESMLEWLQQNGVTLGIISNKPEVFVQFCAEHFFPNINFCAVLGEVDGYEKKPDTKRLEQTLKALHVELDFFVGDTKIDMQTAKNINTTALGVLWGFRDEDELRSAGADEVFSTPNKLLEFFKARV